MKPDANPYKLPCEAWRGHVSGLGLCAVTEEPDGPYAWEWTATHEDDWYLSRDSDAVFVAWARSQRERAEKAEREAKAARDEAERLRHGVGVEGDFVCPNAAELERVTRERDVAFARVRDAEELYAGALSAGLSAAREVRERAEKAELELDEAWSAASAPVRGWVPLSEVIADLRARHEEAQSENARLRNAALAALAALDGAQDLLRTVTVETGERASPSTRSPSRRSTRAALAAMVGLLAFGDRERQPFAARRDMAGEVVGEVGEIAAIVGPGDDEPLVDAVARMAEREEALRCVAREVVRCLGHEEAEHVPMCVLELERALKTANRGDGT